MRKARSANKARACPAKTVFFLFVDATTALDVRALSLHGGARIWVVRVLFFFRRTLDQVFPLDT